MKDTSTIKWPEGLKRTKTRESVLSVLIDSHSPLSAIEIFSEIENRGESIWLSTVYRILDAFVEKGLVTKTSVLNNEITLYDLTHSGHKHYAVCIDCHKIVTMENCPMDDFKPKFKNNDIEVLGHKVEIYGYCKDCKHKS
ncbi:MAG: Fur family transcriptional regulator [Tissierellaceae bacterium]|nr:Fur family transcriptional regulator [Tissierellaceae bacterium]